MQSVKLLLSDLLLVAGAASVTYGAWLVYPPAGYIVGGAMGVYAGMRL